EVAKRRMAESRGSIEPFRLKCNLLSSQAMGFNLFAPLVDDRELADRLLKTVLPDANSRVTRVTLAYAPQPAQEYLNDRTLLDACVQFTLPRGELGFVGVVTWLVEETPTKLFASPRYRELTVQPGSPWLEDALSHLVQPELNLLWRAHLLVEAMLHHPQAKYTQGKLIFVFHPQDQASLLGFLSYCRWLRPENANAVELIPLDQFVERWQALAETPLQQRWLADFHLRYLDVSASEEEYGHL
ncbi:MAG: hypothetical protein PHQ40_18575, partial [Anaerolineaceae bacterium]|nr:hypothetical protein [Anaerolineaceae bacterium]